MDDFRSKAIADERTRFSYMALGDKCWFSEITARQAFKDERWKHHKEYRLRWWQFPRNPKPFLLTLLNNDAIVNAGNLTGFGVFTSRTICTYKWSVPHIVRKEG